MAQILALEQAHGTQCVLNVSHTHSSSLPYYAAPAHLPVCKQPACLTDESPRLSLCCCRYDLVLSTREDAHLLQPLLLHPLLASANSSTLHNSSKPHDSGKPHADNSKPHADSSSKSHEEACDLYAKDCLTWGADGMPGLNMRMQIYRRHAGLRMLSSRLTFFASLYAERTKIKNPETYEWAQAARLGLRVCPRPPSLIPVVVARHTRDGAYCFPRDELEDRGAKHHAACLPPLKPMQPDPMANMCPEAPRKSSRWPWQPQVFRLR